MDDLTDIDLENLRDEDLRRIDDHIHAAVMGLTIASSADGSILLPERLLVRHYSADKINVFEIVEAMREKGLSFCLSAHAFPPDTGWEAEFTRYKDCFVSTSIHRFKYNAPSPALAVCIAALKALGEI